MEEEFQVIVTPRARISEVVWLGDRKLKVKVHAVPEGGKANQEVIALLAEEFGVAKSNIEIIHGLTAKTKLVKIVYSPKSKINQ